MLPSGLQALFEILEEPGAVSSPLLVQIHAELAVLRASDPARLMFKQEGLLNSQITSFPGGIVGGQIIAGSVGAGGSCKLCGRTIAGFTAQIMRGEGQGQVG